MDTVLDPFECPICLQECTEPKFLICHHTCCKSCLESLPQQNNKLVCPLCRRITDIPLSGISGLQSNFYIQTSHKPKPCKDGKCKERKVFCKNCQQYLCDSCKEIHHLFNACKHHVLIPANEDQEVPPKHIIPFCDQHPGTILDNYCYDCSIGICSICNMGTLLHRSHEVVDLKYAELQCDEDLYKLKKRVEFLSDYFTNNVTFSGHTLYERTELSTKMHNSIDKQAKKLCDIVNGEAGKIAGIINDNQNQTRISDYIQKLGNVYNYTRISQPCEAKPVETNDVQSSRESHHDGASTKQYFPPDILTTDIEIELTNHGNENLIGASHKLQNTSTAYCVRRFNICEFTTGKLNRSKRLSVGKYSFILTAQRYMEPTAIEKLQVMLERIDEDDLCVQAYIVIKLKTSPLFSFEQNCTFLKKGSKNGCNSFMSWKEIEENVRNISDVLIFHASIAIEI